MFTGYIKKKQCLNYSIKVIWTKVNVVSNNSFAHASKWKTFGIHIPESGFRLSFTFIRKSGQVIRSIISEVNPVSIEKSQFLSRSQAEIDIVRLKFHRVFTASWIYRFPVGWRWIDQFLRSERTKLLFLTLFRGSSSNWMQVSWKKRLFHVNKKYLCHHFHLLTERYDFKINSRSHVNPA